MSNERTIWNIYIHCISGALEAARDGEVRDDLDPRNWVYSTTAPGLMTQDEARAWAAALANLGKAPELQRKSSAWRPCDERAARCECDLLPAECLCARMREQVPRSCPLTARVRGAWVRWAMACLGASQAADFDRDRYADGVALRRAREKELGQVIAYEIAREHPMDRADREIADGLHDVMGKLETLSRR